MLAMAAAMAVAWLAAVCETHDEACHSACVCALPCCQAVVLTDHYVLTSDPEPSGIVVMETHRANTTEIGSIFRPPQA